MTARSKRYGAPGDILRVRGTDIRIRLLAVVRTTLGYIAVRHWKQEGVSGTAEFVGIWERIRPRTGFDSRKKVWAHVFEVVR